MKTFAVILLLVSSAFGQTFVQGKMGIGSGSVTFTSNNTAGNNINAVNQENITGSGTTCIVTDTNGNTYTKIGAIQNAATLQILTVWNAKNIAGGANTVTFSGCTNSFEDEGITEQSGIDTTTPVGDLKVAQGAATPFSAGTLTITPGSLVFGFAFVGCGVTGQAAGYTLIPQTAGSVGLIYKVESGASANPTVSQACANNAAMVSWELKAAGGPPPASHTPTLPEMGVGMATLNPDNIVPLIGISSVVAASLPPVGGRNQVRYLEMSIDSLFKYGLLVPDKSDDITLSASKSFAANYMRMANGYKLVGFNSPLVDYAEMVLKIETVKGVTNWIAVENDLNIITDFAFVQDWIKPGTAKVSQVKAFMLEFTHIVDNYNHGY